MIVPSTTNSLCHICGTVHAKNRCLCNFRRLHDQLPGIPGCLGRFDRKNGGGQMKNGAVTGSISQMETRLRLSPAVDSSQPTYQENEIVENVIYIVEENPHIAIIITKYLQITPL